MMNTQKIGIFLSLSLFIHCSSFGQLLQKPSPHFLNKQFQTIKRDIFLIKKCLLNRSCSEQEKKETKKALIRLTIEVAAFVTLLWGMRFVYKKITVSKALDHLIAQKGKLFIQESSGAIGANPEISTQFLRAILGTNAVSVGDEFLAHQLGLNIADIVASASDDRPVGRPIYDKNNTLIGAVGIRPGSQEEIGIVLYAKAPSSYHQKLNDLRKSIAFTRFDHGVNHWPYIFEEKWGMTGEDVNPGAHSPTPQRVITHLMIAGRIGSYALINLAR